MPENDNGTFYPWQKPYFLTVTGLDDDGLMRLVLKMQDETRSERWINTLWLGADQLADVEIIHGH